MKILYKILFLFILINNGFALSAKNNNSELNIEKIKKAKVVFTTNNLVLPSATISGTTTVCQNAAQPQIKFTGSGGTAPYTFTYNINGGTLLTVSTAGTNSSVTVSANTTTATTLNYNLISVHDTANPTTEQASSGSAIVTVNSPLVVDFIFTNDNSCSGTIIQFSANVSAGSYTYSWDFGDGTITSTQQNPSHSFVSLGCTSATFNVTLTVIGGGCTVTKTKTITVIQKPDISFTDIDNPFDPFNNCGNASSNSVYSITVGNSSISTCISSFSINWGDGNSENNIAFPISHTYPSNGAYSMTITANGNNGCTNSKTYIVKNVSNPLGGLNSPGSTQNLCAPTSNLQFSISNWGSNSLDTTYKIDYSDGSPIVVFTQTQLNSSIYFNAANPSNSSNYPIPHIYTSSSCPASSFEVKLDVTNACGSTPFTLGSIIILTKSEANFTAPSSSCINNAVLFTNTTISGYGQNCTTGSIYSWDFGDGSAIVTTSIINPQNINHTYSNLGSYTVTLTAQNGCGTSTKTQQICIEPALTPQFTLNTNSGCSPLLTTATNTTLATNSCSPPTYVWSATYTPSYCGTSITAIPNQTTTNASFNFTEPGTYTIKLTATNSCSPPQVATQVVTVKKPPTVTIDPIANFCGPTTINPTATINSCSDSSSGLTYAWSFPGGTPSTSTLAVPGAISYSSAANYTVSLIVTNECGPSSTATKSFTINDAPTLTNTPLSQTVCSGAATALVNLTASSSAATFSWTATATAGISGFSTSGTNTIPIQTISTTNTNSGTVTYAITPSLGTCSGAISNYVINVNPAPIITSQPASSTICQGGVPTILSVSISGAAGTIMYQWYSNTANNTTSGATIASATNSTYSPPSTITGTIYYYCVITLSSGGCSAITSNAAAVTVLANTTINLQPIATQNLCVGATIPTPLSINSTGTSGFLSYQWFSNTTNSNIGGSAISGATNSTYTMPVFTISGNYYYYAVASLNGNGCVPAASNVAEVVVYSDPTITVQPISSQTICLGTSPSNLEVTATGGNGAFSYQWYSNLTNSNSGGTIVPGATSSSYSPNENVIGTKYYYCIVTQNSTLGCSVTSATAAVIVNSAAIITKQPDSSTSCLGGSPNILSVAYSNGVGTATYQWYSNTTNSLTGGTAIFAATTANFTPPNMVVGTVYYYCVITLSSGGCSNLTSAIAEVIINPNPVISPKTALICSGNSFSIAPQNSAGDIVPNSTLYSWTSPISSPVGVITGATSQTIPQTIISQTLVNPTSTPATVTYTVTPISGLCRGSNFTIVVTVNPSISNTVTLSNSSCFGANNGSIQTTITGGIPFSTGPFYILNWTGPNGFTSAAAGISNLAPGMYELSITDAGGCPIVKPYEITGPDDISITTDVKKDITCFNAADGAIAITVSGGTLNYSYAWTKNGNPYATTKDISNLGPGLYVVSVSDAKNCGPKTKTFIITEPPILAVSLISQTNILCFGESTGAINISAVGGTPAISGYNFAWTGPSGFTSSNKNLSAIIAGTYDLVVTDNSNCSKTLTVTLSQPSEMVINATVTPVICYGNNDASIKLEVTGGVAPYTILWNNLASGSFQDNLTPGDYLIVVTDALNCTKSLNVNIPEVPVFTINPVVKNINCFGEKNGSINLNLLGGITPIILTWDDSSVAGTVRNNLGSGSYTVSIVDGKQCTIKRTFIILEPQSLVLSANVTNAFACDNVNSGSIKLLVAGGTAPFSYQWSNGATTKDLTNIPTGNYLVTVKDVNGCSEQAQFSINRPPPIVTAVVTETDFDCETKYIKQTFKAQVSGGVPPYNLAWSSGTVSGANNEMMNTSQNGTAILFVTDAIGCKADYSFNVKLQSIGTASYDASSSSYLTYGNYSVNDPIQFTSTATGDYVSVAWDFGDGAVSTDLNPIHSFILPKDYVVTQTVTYPFGCVYVQKITFTIGKGYLLVVPNAFTPNDDNLNDTFRPVTKALKNIRLDIYDTWGAMLYSETAEILRGWDGKIKGQNAENGNYYCKVSGETFYGTVVNVNQPFVLIK
ncbi:PKD domain-containing protein [Flavobacterium degerlachei]|jgi:gliding motility-associated-like protein|uniref:Gliding motility-associated C-terminal domain-containing protein n=1 Tax=Flavobacterium degerlachei TaxID=229203 RepID=A0A1H2ZIK0_9FLAO|nr:PKD domain-containing protein [Flavobacterium degerlachei]SDX17293.1 gliding motility-associated C-terminal domain-containing protein [Flavobacterium degerlachei]